MEIRTQPLRGRLRTATAAAHQSLEAAMDIGAHCRNACAYRGMLERLWGIYAPLEAALARIDWPGAEPLVRRRAKAGWLASDLAFLGLTPCEIVMLPRAAAIPRIDTAADVLGVAYVLEGATLGGQVILPKLKSALGVSEQAGGRFFASYGRQVGRQWRAFVVALEDFGGHPPVDDRIEGAALQAFEYFRLWMSDGAPLGEGLDHG